MTALKAPLARLITANWNATFPEFDVYKPLWLMRRLGPLLQGISLEPTRDGSEYIATSHVHALTRQFPVISLTLGRRSDRVNVAHHERDFPAAASKLRDVSYLPLAGVPTADAVVAAYQLLVTSNQEKGYPPAVPESEDSILVPVLLERPDLVEASLELAARMADAWIHSRLPLDWPGAIRWLEIMRAQVVDRARLQEIVDGEILKHKLAAIRDVAMGPTPNA